MRKGTMNYRYLMLAKTDGTPVRLVGFYVDNDDEPAGGSHAQVELAALAINEAILRMGTRS
jgi:hypothetical protein